MMMSSLEENVKLDGSEIESDNEDELSLSVETANNLHQDAKSNEHLDCENFVDDDSC